MSVRKKPLKTLGLRIIDRLNLGVLLRNLFHDLKYLLNFRAVAKNRRFRKSVRRAGTAAALPYPPLRLIYRVAGHFDLEQFANSGRLGAENIRRLLNDNGLSLPEFSAVLDFGCGCGRVFRHWAGLAGPRFFGCDFQRPLVRWCRAHLPFGTFERNGLLSPFSYPGGSFDFIYAISVFTHLEERGQFFWMSELRRIIRENGHLLITVHGTTRLAELSAEERQEFEAGQPIVHQAKYSGSNVCATYHPRAYVQDVLGSGFRLVDFRPGGAPDANQDAYFFEKA